MDCCLEMQMIHVITTDVTMYQVMSLTDDSTHVTNCMQIFNTPGNTCSWVMWRQFKGGNQTTKKLLSSQIGCHIIREYMHWNCLFQEQIIYLTNLINNHCHSFDCEQMIQAMYLLNTWWVSWLTTKNMKSREVKKWKVVWLRKAGEVQLAAKFYFLQNGGSRLPSPPKVSDTSCRKFYFMLSNVNQTILGTFGSSNSWELQLIGIATSQSELNDHIV